MKDITKRIAKSIKELDFIDKNNYTKEEEANLLRVILNIYEEYVPNEIHIAANNIWKR